MARRLCVLAFFVFLSAAVVLAANPRCEIESSALPSWNDTATKAALLEFVRRVTTPGDPAFVPEPERIAVFDNDGTL